MLRGSSDLPGGCGAPSRHAPQANPRLPPYLVLLRVGFALPAALLRRRCALTAPFHPYPGVAAEAVYFLWHFPSTGLEPGLPDVIRHTALRSSDFPPSPLDAARATARSSCQQAYYSGLRASDLGRQRHTRPRIYTDSHGSPFFFVFLIRVNPCRSVARFVWTSVRQVPIQLLNLPESVGQAFLDRRKRG